MINIGQVITASIEHSHEEHSHDAHSHGEYDFWEGFLALLTDPAHIAFEIFFTLVFDVLVVTVLYGIIVKKIIIPRLRKSIHEEIDREHGVEHEHSVKRKVVKEPSVKNAEEPPTETGEPAGSKTP